MNQLIIVFIIFGISSLARTYNFQCQSNNSWRKQPRIYLNYREILTTTAYDFKMIVDRTDQMVSDAILNKGTWQPQYINLIANLIKPNQTILNLGSQTGLQAILMGKLTGQNGFMYIFEPYSVSYKILVKNLYLNKLQKISKYYKMAAGSAKSTFKLWIDLSNTGHSSLINNPEHGNEYQEVQIDRIDDILSKDIKIDFSLIDVEEYEIQALLGMFQLLQRSKSIIILLQWRFLDNKFRDNQRATYLLNWLEQNKFKWYRYKYKQTCILGTLQQLLKDDLLLIKQEDVLLVGPQSKIKQYIS